MKSPLHRSGEGSGGRGLSILLLSDPHAHWSPRYLHYAEPCDEIWLAGDIVDPTICDRLEATGKPCRIVYGNADGPDLRLRYPEHQRFELEGLSIWMTHIGGYPGHWPRAIRQELLAHPVDLMVCGHSHICRAMYDHQLRTLLLNPGACGTYGQQTVRTLMRFTLHAGRVESLEVIELVDSKGQEA